LSRERIRQLELKCYNIKGYIAAKPLFEEVKEIAEAMLTKLGGFAHYSQLQKQLVEDFQWQEKDCSPYFVKYFFQVPHCTIVYHRKNYYSANDYPCFTCKKIFSCVDHYSIEYPNLQLTYHEILPVIRERICKNCSKAAEDNYFLTQDFLEWKADREPEFAQLFEEKSAKRSLQKLIFLILKDAEKPLNLKEIYTRLCEYPEMQSATKRRINSAVMSLSMSHQDIFHWDWGGIFTHRKHIPVNAPILIPIEERLRQLLKQRTSPYVSLYTIFQDEFREECIKAGIPSAFALYTSLKAKGLEGVTFVRSPYVSNSSHEKPTRTNTEILGRWAAKQNRVFSKKSLEKYASKIGIDSIRFAITFVHLPSVVAYEKTMYLHLDYIKWTEKKNQRLMEIALEHWKRCRSQKNIIAFTDNLLAERKKNLPKLANGVAWTPELLFSLLERNEEIITFGNTHLAFGFRRGKTSPKSFCEVIFNVLKNKFGGAANFDEFSDYVRDELRLVKRRLTPRMLKKATQIEINENKIWITAE